MAMVSTANASFMARRRRLRKEPEWEGRGTIAYMTKQAKENFESLPEDVHQRLQNAASELNAQNSVVPRFLKGLEPGKTASINTAGLSGVERYELARYQVDHPPEENDTEAGSRGDGLTSGRPSGHSTRKGHRQDYVRYLIERTPRWTASGKSLDDVKEFRKRLTDIGSSAITKALEECNLSAALCPTEFRCIGSYLSGFALSESHLDVLLEYHPTMPHRISSQLPICLVRAFLDHGLCAALRTSPVNAEDVIVSVCQKANDDFLQTMRDKYKEGSGNDRSKTYIPESMGLQCHIHFAPHAMMYYSSDLLGCYYYCDNRVPEMTRVIKKWLQGRRINDTENGFPTTYAYMIMLLHYLLHVAEPPIVPNLLLTTHGSESRKPRWVAGREINYWSDKVEIIASAQAQALSKNHQCVGVLLREFFAYYSTYRNGFSNSERLIPEFIWKNDVVSARQPGLKKFHKGWGSISRGPKGAKCWNFLAIEDPFEPGRNVGEYVHPVKVNVIRDEFSRAHRILCNAEYAGKGNWQWRDEKGKIGDDLLDIRNPSAAELDLAEQQLSHQSGHSTPTNRIGIMRRRACVPGEIGRANGAEPKTPSIRPKRSSPTRRYKGSSSDKLENESNSMEKVAKEERA